MTQGSKNAVFPKPQTPLLVKIQLPSECGMESQETWHRASRPLSSFEQLWNSVFSNTFIPGFPSLRPWNGWKDMLQARLELPLGGVRGPEAHRCHYCLVLGHRVWWRTGSEDHVWYLFDVRERKSWVFLSDSHYFPTVPWQYPKQIERFWFHSGIGCTKHSVWHCAFNRGLLNESSIFEKWGLEGRQNWYNGFIFTTFK